MADDVLNIELLLVHPYSALIEVLRLGYIYTWPERNIGEIQSPARVKNTPKVCTTSGRTDFGLKMTYISERKSLM